MRRAVEAGLPELRRAGAVGELLFLYVCATRSPTQLRPIAQELGVTVQAASHAYRGLRRAGLAERVAGHYRPTVPGVAWLHETFGALRDDVEHRLAQLHIIRSCRAVAAAPIRAGHVVSLELRDGWLLAQPGRRRAAHGVARTAARVGELVEVEQLQGIVPIPPGRLTLVALPDPQEITAGLQRDLAAVLARRPPGFFGAVGMEAAHIARRASAVEPLRFGVAAAAAEAARLGVPGTIVLLGQELPRFIQELPGPSAPAVEVVHLGRRPHRRDPAGRRRRGG